MKDTPTADQAVAAFRDRHGDVRIERLCLHERHVHDARVAATHVMRCGPEIVVVAADVPAAIGALHGLLTGAPS